MRCSGLIFLIHYLVVMKKILPRPRPALSTANYTIGSRIRFVCYKKPLIIKTGEIVGIDTEDRVLVRYEIGDGTYADKASVHLARLLTAPV